MKQNIQMKNYVSFFTESNYPKFIYHRILTLQWLSAFLILKSFTKIPHAVLTHNHKFFCYLIIVVLLLLCIVL